MFCEVVPFLRLEYHRTVVSSYATLPEVVKLRLPSNFQIHFPPITSNSLSPHSLRRLAMEKIDLSKDPYFMRNHVGTFECRLCLTVHTNEGSYLAHTQGKKHQVNLARRQQREKQAAEQGPGGTAVSVPTNIVKKTGGVKIGRPGYKVTKCRDPDTKQMALLFESRSCFSWG